MLINLHSQSTQKRVESASVDLVTTDEDLAAQSDYILSIVPPRDAHATAKRIVNASSSATFTHRPHPLYYMDLNAISPRSARELSDLFAPVSDKIRFLDGGIIGGAPKPATRDFEPTSSTADDKDQKVTTWTRPSIPISGPHTLVSAPVAGAHLASLLNSSHISPSIGAASGLKMCFASLTKGFTALAIQSFTTASRMGVLDELQEQLKQYSPKTGEMTQGLTSMPPKAYRWVREMEEIRDTFAADGGFGEEEDIYGGVARVYELVANGTVLGDEMTADRKRGRTVEDVAKCVSEGVDGRKRKME